MSVTKVGFIGVVIGLLIGSLSTYLLRRPSLADIAQAKADTPAVEIAKVAEVKTDNEVKDHTVTVVEVKKPDGEVVTTTTHDDVETRNVQETRPVQTRYRLGVKEQYDFNAHGYSTEFDISKRVYDNIWLDGGYNASQRQVTIGFSYEI